MNTRRLRCAEADYLQERGVPLTVAVLYEYRFGPAAIRELHEAGITPDLANKAPTGLNASEVVAYYCS